MNGGGARLCAVAPRRRPTGWCAGKQGEGRTEAREKMTKFAANDLPARGRGGYGRCKPRLPWRPPLTYMHADRPLHSSLRARASNQYIPYPHTPHIYLAPDADRPASRSPPGVMMIPCLHATRTPRRAHRHARSTPATVQQHARHTSSSRPAPNSSRACGSAQLSIVSIRHSLARAPPPPPPRPYSACTAPPLSAPSPRATPPPFAADVSTSAAAAS